MNPLFYETWRWSLEQLDRGIQQAIQGVGTIKVRWVDAEDAPQRLTWTSVADGEIGIVREVVERWFAERDVDEATMRLIGLNLHELARVLFSPVKADVRARIERLVAVNATGDSADELRGALLFAYAVLEDHRIDQLLIDWYPEAAPALATVAAAIVLDYEGEHPEGQAKLVVGRSHLPPELLTAVRADYAAAYGEDELVWLEEIVAAYVQLRGPEDLDEMVRLAVELVALEHHDLMPAGWFAGEV